MIEIIYPDVLCVFGRGIEVVRGAWQPTQHIERLSEKNRHPGVRVPGIDPNDDDPQVVIAGAEFNAVAAAKFYAWLAEEGCPPRLVTFAAGRPAYIATDPDPTLSEGEILKRRFLEVLSGDKTTVHPNTEIIVQGKNKNTYDDLIQTIHLMSEKHLSSVVVVSVLVHLARCYGFLEIAQKEVPGLNPDDVRFLPSELLLMLFEPRRTQQLAELFVSKAYCRTAEHERNGLADIRSGKYDLETQGYGFSKR